MSAMSSEQTLVSSLNSFSFKLYSQLSVGKNENFFISPFSIMTALSMVLTGARTKTGEQLKALLNLTNLTSDEILEINNEYLSGLNDLNDEFTDLNSANKLFAKEGFVLNKEYCKNLEKYFLTEIKQLDFSKNIEAANKMNNWVSNKTHNKINNIIDASSISADTMIVLINAIYFKATWSNQFKEFRTEKQDFHLLDGSIQQVDMMNQEKRFQLQVNPQGLKASLCTIPYKAYSVFMTIVLPDRDSNIVEVEKTLKFEHLLRKEDLQSSRVNLSIPKFKMNFKSELTECIKNMGADLAFDPKNSDFSGISSSKLAISQIIHQTFIEVDENGTEAAAATAVQMMLTCAFNPMPEPEPIEFKCDRPFIFVIHTADNGILFMGKHVQPSS